MGLDLSDQAIFIGMVFIASFLLVQSFIVPTFGENRQARKRLRARLDSVTEAAATHNAVSLLRQKQRGKLSPLERRIEALPGMDALEHLIDQAGRETLAYPLVLKSVAMALVVGFAFGIIFSSTPLALLAGLGAGAMPFLSLLRARGNRLMKFEEQFPEALVVMARALRAGHPFADALNLVAEEMPEPIGPEFRRTFMEINYGGEVRTALNGLLGRIGSVTVMVFVTSVLIQKETGGNLAELLEGLASVIRDRFRFHRKLRTLSAEGRLAAWVLSLLPFALAGLLTVISPDFLPMLTGNAIGRRLVMAAFVLTIIGILWMRKIVRIDA